MPLLSENIGLKIENNQHVSNLVDYILHNKRTKMFQGYADTIYLYLSMGLYEFYLNSNKIENGKYEVKSVELHIPGIDDWDIKVLSSSNDNDIVDLLKKQVIATRPNGDGLAVINIVCSDIIPSYDEGEILKVQIVGFPLYIDYYKDEDEFEENQEENKNGEKYLIADGMVFPINFLLNHQIDKDGKKISKSESTKNDDIMLIRGTVKEIEQVGPYGEEKIYIKSTINTSFGLLPLIHTIDQVEAKYRENMKVGACVMCQCVLSGDVRIYEHEDGILKDEEHNLSLLKSIILNGDAKRLQKVLDADVVYKAGYNSKDYVGTKSVVERLDFVFKKTEHKYFVQKATIESIDDGENDLEFNIGKRCLVLSTDDIDNYDAILFIKVNENGDVTYIETTQEGRYHFKFDEYIH